MTTRPAHPRVIVTSRPDAADLLSPPHEGPRIRHLVSIGDPGESLPEGFETCPSRLRLEFYDVLDDLDFARGPRAGDAAALVAFAQRIASDSGILLTHCYAGISRGPAAALGVLATWLGRESVDEAVATLFRIKPDAAPNARFIELIDDALSWDGDLLAALRRVDPWA